MNEVCIIPPEEIREYAFESHILVQAHLTKYSFALVTVHSVVVACVVSAMKGIWRCKQLKGSNLPSQGQEQTSYC